MKCPVYVIFWYNYTETGDGTFSFNLFSRVLQKTFFSERGLMYQFHVEVISLGLSCELS